MSQSCFSLGFLSQNSLWKLSTFRGYKGIYSRVYEECEESVTTKQGILMTQGMRRVSYNQTGHFDDSSSRLERVASLSRELIA